MSYKITDLWNVDTKSIYNTSKNVGIGTNNPNSKLDVNGTISGTEIKEDNKKLEDKYVQIVGKEKFTDILISKIPNEYVLEDENKSCNLESNLLIRYRFDKGENFLKNTSLRNKLENDIYKNFELEIYTNDIDYYGNNYIIGDASMYLNGTDTYLKIKNGINDNIEIEYFYIEELSITCWFRIEELQSSTLFDFNQNNDCFFKLFFDDLNNTIKYQINNYDDTNIYSFYFDNNLIDINEWYHIDIIFKKRNDSYYDKGEFYLNGIQLVYNIEDQSSNPYTINDILYFKSNGNNWYHFIGVDKGLVNYFKGYIDDFRIYDKNLTQDDIKNELTGEVLKLTTKGISTFGNRGIYLKPYEQKIGLGTVNPEKNIHLSGDVLIDNGNLYTNTGYIDNLESSNINVNKLNVDIINENILISENEIDVGNSGIIKTSNLVVTGNFNPNEIILDNLVSKQSLICDGISEFNGLITVNDVMNINSNIEFNDTNLLGTINIKGSEKIISGGEISVKSGGNVLIENGGILTVENGGSLILNSGSVFTINTSLTFDDIVITTLNVTTLTNNSGVTTLGETDITGILDVIGNMTTNNLNINSGNTLTVSSGAFLSVLGDTTFNEDIIVNSTKRAIFGIEDSGNRIIINKSGFTTIKDENDTTTFSILTSTGNMTSSGSITADTLDIDTSATLETATITNSCTVKTGTLTIGDASNTQNSRVLLTPSSLLLKSNSTDNVFEINSSGDIICNSIDVKSYLLNGETFTGGGSGGTTYTLIDPISVKSLTVADEISRENNDIVRIDKKLHITDADYTYYNYSGGSERSYMNLVVLNNDSLAPGILSIGNNSIGVDKTDHILTDESTEIGKIEFIANQNTGGDSKKGFTTHEINFKKQINTSGNITRGTISIQGGESTHGNIYQLSVGNWNDDPKLEFFTNNTTTSKFSVDKDGNVNISGNLTVSGQIEGVTDTSSDTKKWIGRLYLNNDYNTEQITKDLEDMTVLEYKIVSITDTISSKEIWSDTETYTNIGIDTHIGIWTTGIYVPKEITQDIYVSDNTYIKIDTIYQIPSNTNIVRYIFSEGIHKIQYIIKYQ
tara:strand:+ start:16262 stop:19498 length:3237 start_codon:yes stop_codon:yes gene_type:complete